MLDALRKLTPEQWFGLALVIVLHGAALFVLWSYRILPTPDEAVTLMVNLINPPAPEKPQPEPPKPQPKLRPIEPPKPKQLVAQAPVVLADEPVAPPAPVVIEAPPLPPQPVMLSGELSVSCPERSPPSYPAYSMRMNEQGRVVLLVELNTEGRVSNVQVKTASGYHRLDEAAVNAVKGWRCKPAIRDGVSVIATALQPFVFVMEGR
jgi:protein TonB